MNARDAVATNIRRARAGANLSQSDVSERMRNLGFTAWQHSTTSLAEQGKRRVTADELFGLAQVLETTVRSLMDVSANGVVFFPNDREVVSRTLVSW